MKQIQKELGDEDERNDVEELRERIEELELIDEAKNEVERELRRLERTSPQSAEYQVIRTFLEWVTEIPWNLRTEDKIDLVEFLAVRKLQMERFEEEEEAGAEEEATEEAAADEEAVEVEVDETEADAAEGEGGGAEVEEDPLGRGPILLFVGPPGVGKTSIARSIARSLGRKYVRISLGGARDEADIRGHRRTYVGAMPGRIIQGMRQAKSKNPVFLLDEVDKLGVSFQGDPSAALLEVLDPAQNSTFTDHYLGVPFDLSEVLFVATANYLDRIPAPLLDRMERVEFPGYTEREKLEIAKRYLLPRQERAAGLRDGELLIGDETALAVIQKYTREAGVRQLERELGKLARKVARQIAAGKAERVEVTLEIIRDLLGRPRVHPEEMAAEDQVGVATGMYYAPMGGDIMFVEASIMPGEGGLVLTGQLGDVMKESGRAALSYAKSHYDHLGIAEDTLKGREVHIHVPAGAVPKDGPSAGITMATALVSALSGKKVRRDVAMTGELTLTGRVLPIGGVKEKVLGAIRAGIREIILPADNENDLEDISEEVREMLTVHPVDDLDQVIAVALREGPRKAPRKAGVRKAGSGKADSGKSGTAREKKDAPPAGEATL